MVTVFHGVAAAVCGAAAAFLQLGTIFRAQGFARVPRGWVVNQLPTHLFLASHFVLGVTFYFWGMDAVIWAGGKLLGVEAAPYAPLRDNVVLRSAIACLIYVGLLNGRLWVYRNSDGIPTYVGFKFFSEFPRRAVSKSLQRRLNFDKERWWFAATEYFFAASVSDRKHALSIAHGALLVALAESGGAKATHYMGGLDRFGRAVRKVTPEGHLRLGLALIGKYVDTPMEIQRYLDAGIRTCGGSPSEHGLEHYMKQADQAGINFSD